MEKAEILKNHIEAFNRGDWDAYKRSLTDDVVYDEEATQRRVQGPDTVIELLQKWKSAFPDLKGTLRATFPAADAIVAEIEWEGTQDGLFEGPMGTLPASGKHGTVAAVEVVRFDGELISEIRHYFDLLTILRQLGVSPEARAPAPSVP